MNRYDKYIVTAIKDWDAFVAALRFLRRPKMKIETLKPEWKPVELDVPFINKMTLSKAIMTMAYSTGSSEVYLFLNRLLIQREDFPVTIRITFETFEELAELRETLGNGCGSYWFFEMVKDLHDMYREDFE